MQKGIRRYQKEIVKLEGTQYHDQQIKMKDKHRTQGTSLKPKAGVTRPLQKTNFIK